jgi:hypothetical protein
MVCFWRYKFGRRCDSIHKIVSVRRCSSYDEALVTLVPLENLRCQQRPARGGGQKKKRENKSNHVDQYFNQINQQILETIYCLYICVKLISYVKSTDNSILLW